MVVAGWIIGTAAGLSPEEKREPIVRENVTAMAPADIASEASANVVSTTCRPAITAMGGILGGLKGGASVLRRPYAVALDPPVGSLRFVVVAEIDGIGALAGNGQVGAWAMAATDGSGLILAVDDNAQRYSTWGENATEGSPAHLRDQIAARPEVSSAKACPTG